MHRADNLTTFTFRLSLNLGASTSWNLHGLPRPVMGLLGILQKYLTCREQVTPKSVYITTTLNRVTYHRTANCFVEAHDRERNFRCCVAEVLQMSGPSFTHILTKVFFMPYVIEVIKNIGLRHFILLFCFFFFFFFVFSSDYSDECIHRKYNIKKVQE